MSSSRLRGINPGRLGIFAGSLSQQPATVQREVAAEIEKLGFGTLWYGEAIGREAFAQAGIFLTATRDMVVASGIANIWARDPMAMAAEAAPWPKPGPVDSSLGWASATLRSSLREATITRDRSPRCGSIWIA